MSAKHRKLFLCTAIAFAAFFALAVLLLSAPEVSASAKSDEAEAESVILTGRGSPDDPYAGYIAEGDAKNTWTNVDVPCLFGGANANESAPDSYSVISFRVKISGVYSLSVTSQTYRESVTIYAGILAGKEVVKEPTPIRYNNSSTATVAVFEVDLHAGTTYGLRLSGSDEGKDIYVRSARLDYISESDAYPLPQITLQGVEGDVVTGTLGTLYTLPAPSSDLEDLDDDEITVSVYAPDGSCLIPATAWGELTDKSFRLTKTGNYIVRYATTANNYATRTYAVKVEGGISASDKYEINALNFHSVSGYAVDPQLGIGGNNPKASGSITFFFNAYESLKDSPLSLDIEGYSDGGDNDVLIALDDNEPIRYTFARSDSLQNYHIENVGLLHGESATGGIRCRLTVTGLTYGKLTLKSIGGSVSYQGTSYPIIQNKSFTDIYLNEADAVIQGNFVQTTAGLMGFNASETSEAQYAVKMQTGGEYFFIVKYSYLANIASDAEIVVQIGDTELPVVLPVDGTSTPTTEYDAYRISLPAGESTVTIRHAKGKGYYIKGFTISNDLTSPELTFEQTDDLNAFVGVPLTLPCGSVTDNDANARIVALVVSDNAEFADITGAGVTGDPFVFTAERQGEYLLSFTAVDSAENRSQSVYLTIFVSESGTPVIEVDRTAITVRSGFSVPFPAATATLDGQDVTSSVSVTLKDGNGTVLLDAPLSEAAYRATETGSFTIEYYCPTNETAAFPKIVPVTVIPTSSVNGTSSEIILSGGFTTQGNAVVHPGDSAYAQEDAIGFGFRLNSDGEFRFGVMLNLYSNAYVLYVSIDGSEYRRIAAEMGTNPVTAYCDKTFALTAGDHTVSLLGGTVGGDAWLTSVVLESVSGDTRKMITADEIVSSENYRSSGDVRYTQGTLGRLNLNPNPQISYTVTAEVSGWYEFRLTYTRTSIGEAVPLVRLAINDAQYDRLLSANTTAETVLQGRFYLRSGENAVSLSGISSRGYEIRSVEFVFAEQAIVAPAVIAVTDASRTIAPDRSFTVSKATVTGGEDKNLMICVKFNGVTFYRGENKDLTFTAPYEGTYEITYFYVTEESAGVSAAPVTVSVTVKAEQQIVVGPKDDGDNNAVWIAISAVAAVVVVAGGVTAWLVIRKKQHKTAANNEPPHDPQDAE